jgi:chromate reductase
MAKFKVAVVRQILGAQGVLLSGGEAYIQFKPELIDGANNITDEGTRKFLQSFVDQLTALIARPTAQAA